MDGMTGLLEAPTLQEKTYERLRKMIVSGEMPAGSRVKESDLARKFGASRVPIRESLIRLKSEGLVVSKPRYGYMVKKYSAKDIIELYNVREVIEGLAVRLAAEQATDVQIAECEKINHQYGIVLEKQCAMSDDKLEEKIELQNQMALLDERFHRSLLHLSGSSRIEGLFSLLHDERICLALASLKDNPYVINESLYKLTVQAHYNVLLAIKCHDADSAEMEMRKHIKAALKRFMENYENTKQSIFLGGIDHAK